VSARKPSVIVALSPLVEQQLAPLLFGPDAAAKVSASLVELAALERTLNDGSEPAEALLVSADLPDLDAALLNRARTRGLRLVGIATDEHEAVVLSGLPLDDLLTTPIDGEALRVRLTTDREPAAVTQVERPRRRQGRREGREGTVLAIVGSRGAPGATELACSLGALASGSWRALLVELDLLGGSLAVRFGADPGQGSLLALARAALSNDAALNELVDRWLVNRTGWPPVLLAPPQPELAITELDQPGAIRASLDALASQYPLVVCDVGFLLDQPGGIGPVERCHREALIAADAVLLVLGAREAQLDAGLAQLDLLLDTLGIPRERIRVVCNGVGGPGAIPRQQLEQTLTLGLRERELAVDALIPWDARALNKATSTGLPLSAAHPRGGYARTLAGLLNSLFLPGTPVARGRKRMLALPSVLPLPAAHHPTAAGAGETPAHPNDEEEVALPWRS